VVAPIPASIAPVREYWTLVRPRIVALSLFAMLASAWVVGGKSDEPADVLRSLLGTGLVIAGAVALNQRIEVASDARMSRTAGRPLPTGRLSDFQATRFGLLISAAGFFLLALLAGRVVLGLAAISWVVYVLIYTPLKSRTAWQTPVGAVAGAMPVLLGAAATGAADWAMAWSLFALVFLWQLPHSMAIDWLYRRDFAVAGIRVLTVTEPTGRAAAILSLASAAAILPVGIMPVAFGLAGGWYGGAASLLGMVYLGCAVAFARRRDDFTARTLLGASLFYLPAVLVMLMLAARWG
jgi:heme o synthase